MGKKEGARRARKEGSKWGGEGRMTPAEGTQLLLLGNNKGKKYD